MNSSDRIFDIETTDESDVDDARQPDEAAQDFRKRLEIQDRPHFLRLLHQHESADNREKLYPQSLWENVFSQQKYQCEAQMLDHLPKLGRKKHREAYQEGSEFTQVNLSKFSVYHAIYSTQYPGMFEGLQAVASECKSAGRRSFCLDGCIEQPNGSSSFVSGMEVVDVSIGGLSIECHGVQDYIWVQTKAGSEHDDCWYKLSSPAPEYATYWNDFLWIANLSKHCIDFLSSSSDQVGLLHFRIDFWDYISDSHQHHSEFEDWSTLCGHIHDFRKHVIRHRLFLRDQARNVDLRFTKHPVWIEIGAGELSHDLEIQSPSSTTLLTPRVAQGFLKPFSHWDEDSLKLIQVMAPRDTVEQQREVRRLAIGFPDKYVLLKGNDEGAGIASSSRQQLHGISKVQQLHQAAAYGSGFDATRPLKSIMNHVVAVRWEAEFRFGLVMAVTNDAKCVRVVWLAMPCETVCTDKKKQAHYPIADELFLTDYCNCRTVRREAIMAVHSAALFTESAGVCDVFVRSRFLSRENAIVDAGPAGYSEWKRGQCQDMRCPRSMIPTRPSRRESNLLVAPEMTASTLQNLSLFSGAGLFDRALEDHGRISTVSSIDHSEAAILSIRANTSTNESIQHDSVIGSVDQELESYLTGKYSYRQFDMCSAGCPCQGFSRLNNHRQEKTNRKSQKNVSLLASTLSYIDLFLPRYVVIENVVAMDQESPACAQAICQLVALGYQVRKFCTKSSEHGGCTTRERLFIIAAAPQHELPRIPSPTHGIDDGLESVVNARTATGDLPPIENDTTVNLVFPDHIPLERYKLLLREAISVSIRDIVHRIPIKPPAQGLVESYKFLSPIQQQWYDSFAKRNREKLKKGSKMLRRTHADKPLPAVVTKVNYSDARHSGHVLHYDQHRCLSLEEAKRAQGLPDSFLLVGSIVEQHKQVGNGVPWALGSAIGRVIGEAWQRTWDKQRLEDSHHDSPAPMDEEVSDIDSDPIVVFKGAARKAESSRKDKAVKTTTRTTEVIVISSDDEEQERDQSADAVCSRSAVSSRNKDVKMEEDTSADEEASREDVDMDFDEDYDAESDSDESVVFVSERES